MIILHKYQLLFKQVHNIALQLLRIDRFRSVRIKTTVQNALFIFGIDISCHCHNRDRRRHFAYKLCSFVTGLFRHIDIHQYQMGVVLLE